MPRVGRLCICMLLLKLNFYNCILSNTTLKVKPSPNLDSMVALRLLTKYTMDWKSIGLKAID